jgi:hypothetical protein
VKLPGGDRQCVEKQLKSAEGCSEIKQIFLLQNKVKEVLGKIHGYQQDI